jgi:hypothetical protein
LELVCVLKGCLRVDLQPSRVGDAGRARARTGRRLGHWLERLLAKKGRDCKSADCAFQAAAPKAAYSSGFAAPFAFDGPTRWWWLVRGIDGRAEEVVQTRLRTA